MSDDGNVVLHITQMQELVDILTVRGNDANYDRVVVYFGFQCRHCMISKPLTRKQDSKKELTLRSHQK